MNLQRYVGRVVEIIYIDRKNKITQRRVEVRSINGGAVKAFCLQRRAPRVFKMENILAIAPLHGKRTG